MANCQSLPEGSCPHWCFFRLLIPHLSPNKSTQNEVPKSHGLVHVEVQIADAPQALNGFAAAQMGGLDALPDLWWKAGFPVPQWEALATDGWNGGTGGTSDGKPMDLER